MPKIRYINIYVASITNSEYEMLRSIPFIRVPFSRVRVPENIEEIELKGRLRDIGYIEASFEEYNETKVYLYEGERKEICLKNNTRSLKELGIIENAAVLIVRPDRYKKTYDNGWSNMRCLYGCPMSENVKSNIAENYNHSKSIIKNINLD